MMFHLRQIEQFALVLRNFAVDPEGSLVEDEAVELFTLDGSLWKRALDVDEAAVNQRCIELQSQ